MDHQKKQTSDHDRLVREWMEAEKGSCEFVLPASRKNFAGSKTYLSASGQSIRFVEVIADRDVKLVDGMEMNEEQTVIVTKGFRKVAISTAGIPPTIVTKQRDRLIHWLHQQPDIRIIEEKRLLF